MRRQNFSVSTRYAWGEGATAPRDYYYYYGTYTRRPTTRRPRGARGCKFVRKVKHLSPYACGALAAAQCCCEKAVLHSRTCEMYKINLFFIFIITIEWVTLAIYIYEYVRCDKQLTLQPAEINAYTTRTKYRRDRVTLWWCKSEKE